MMGRKIIPLLAALLMMCCCAQAEENAVISDIRLSADTVGQYQCLEITFQTTLTFENPFDPDEIDIQAVFTAPSGQQVVYPAFYLRPGKNDGEDFVPQREQQDYAFDYDTNRYVFVPAEGDCWAVHFSWSEIGTYHFSIQAKTAQGEWSQPGGTFSVIASDEKGPVAQSEKNPAYLCLPDTGE